MEDDHQDGHHQGHHPQDEAEDAEGQHNRQPGGGANDPQGEVEGERAAGGFLREVVAGLVLVDEPHHERSNHAQGREGQQRENGRGQVGQNRHVLIVRRGGGESVGILRVIVLLVTGLVIRYLLAIGRLLGLVVLVVGILRHCLRSFFNQ